jgi:hypothetical protein
MKLKLFLTIAVCALLTSCATIYKSAIILTEAEDAVMREWATAHNNKLTTPDLDLKVMAAHAKFEQAKKVAAVALRAYEAGGDQGAYVAALEACRATIGPLIDLLTNVIAPQRATILRANVATATKLE